MSEINCKWCNNKFDSDENYGYVYTKGFCSADCYHRNRQLEIVNLGLKDQGFMLSRIKTNNIEKEFAEAWQKECEAKVYINHGRGLIQDLFMFNDDGYSISNLELTPENRYVAATVIQWLGTNCGMSFLRQVLNKCGYKITQK